MRRSRRSSLVSEPKTLVFECLSWKIVVYKVMIMNIIEAFKRPTDDVYKVNDNRVLKECLYKEQIKTDTLQVSVAQFERKMTAD